MAAVSVKMSIGWLGHFFMMIIFTGGSFANRFLCLKLLNNESFQRLLLQCFKTLKQSLKTLPIPLTGKKAYNRVYSTICLSHKPGDVLEEKEATMGTTVRYEEKQ